MRVVTVETFLEHMHSGALCVFDVRSSAEFARGALPGARSLPLLDDAERHAVGLAYHQAGRHHAIKVGLDLVGPRLRWYIEQVEQYRAPEQSIGLYCWRGGMRSSALAWLLELYGFQVWTLSGGYKAFRRFVLQTFDQPRTLVVLSGMTGSGKTQLLSVLSQRGIPTVDLERLASHRGSAFGGLGMPPQPTQQNFENALAVELWKHRHAKLIWIEDESRRIGALTIPFGLWSRMQEASIIALDVPVEVRIERLVAEYGTYSQEHLALCLESIRHRLGSQRYTAARTALERGDLATVARITLDHYDKSYRHSLRRRSNRVQWLSTSSLEEAAMLLEHREPAFLTTAAEVL